MRQLVQEQSFAAIRLRGIAARSEHDVVADRDVARVDCTRELVRVSIGVYAHLAESRVESRCQRANGLRQRMTAARECADGSLERSIYGRRGAVGIAEALQLFVFAPI